MPFSSPATEVIMTEVELVMAAAAVVMSTFSPLESSSSMPNSSTNAPRVPEPSSREYTEMLPEDDEPPSDPELPDAQPNSPNIPSASAIAPAAIAKRFFMSTLSFDAPHGRLAFAQRRRLSEPAQGT